METGDAEKTEKSSANGSTIQIEKREGESTDNELIPTKKLAEDKEVAVNEVAQKEEKEDNEKNVPDPNVNSEVPKVEEVKDQGPLVELKVIFNKQPLPIKIHLNKTVGELKQVIEAETKVSASLLKVLVKGIGKDDATLGSLGLKNGSKVLVIGSSLNDVMSVTTAPDAQALADETSKSTDANESWCTLPQHRKIIDKGVPEEAMPGILDENEALPPFPLHGMLGAKGSKVRLTFKLETDELWIGTKERTEKLPISSIRACVSQKIIGFEHYHILAIQLGPTEASRFFVYWVPAQYVEAIKDILGG